MPSNAADPRRLAAELRERISPAYVGIIGTESNERHLCVAAIESLLAQRDALLAVLNELEESASYWSEYDVPAGIVDRIRAAITGAKP